MMHVTKMSDKYARVTFKLNNNNNIIHILIEKFYNNNNNIIHILIEKCYYNNIFDRWFAVRILYNITSG